MKLEKTLICLFVIGVIMKFTHVPMAGATMTVSATALSLLYLGFSWWLLQDKGERRKRVPLSVITGILFSVAPLAVLFKLQYWPGAGLMLLVSFTYCSILLLIMMLKQRMASMDANRYNNRIIVRAGIFAVLCSVLYLTPWRALLRLQHRDNPQEADIRADYYAHPENEEYKRRFMELNNR